MRVLALLSLSLVLASSTSTTAVVSSSGPGPHIMCPLFRCLFVCPPGTVTKKSTNGCPTCGCDPVTPPIINPITTTPIIPSTTAAPSPTIATPCPDGSQQVQCFVDPCQTATCSAFPNAVCRPDYCGGCNANFYDEAGSLVDCSTTNNAEFTTTPTLDSTLDPNSDSDFSNYGSSGVLEPDLPSKPILCGPACMIWCENGHVLDSNGCPSCKCNPSPTSTPTTTTTVTVVAASTSTSTSSPPATTPTPKKDEPFCGLLCMIACPYGHVMDARGCPLCSCNPSPSSPTLPAFPSSTPTARPPVIAIPLPPPPPAPTPARVISYPFGYPFGTVSNSPLTSFGGDVGVGVGVGVGVQLVPSQPSHTQPQTLSPMIQSQSLGAQTQVITLREQVKSTSFASDPTPPPTHIWRTHPSIQRK